MSASITQAEKAHRFRLLHAGPAPFIMPNPWDGGSARLLAAAGFEALATSSWAAAASLGRRDGALSRDEALRHARLVVESTDLPVSGDLENGFGPSVDAVALTLRQAAEVGLVGASIEDATGDPGEPLYPLEHAVARIEAAVSVVRGLPFPFVLTARAEGLIRGRPDLRDIIRRLQAFEAAGADVLFAPGLKDLASIETVCRSVGKPVNVMNALPQPFTVEQLAAAGSSPHQRRRGSLPARAGRGSHSCPRNAPHRHVFICRRGAALNRDLGLSSILKVSDAPDEDTCLIPPWDKKRGWNFTPPALKPIV
jgi:2-methylisocitrate lyase-like PEP mutase family enzyme